MKVRYVIKFSKGEEIKFIGHLDLMRTIQRIIKRSGLPVEYSKGFNPHMALSIAQPLSVGVYSDGEYLDLVLTESLGVGEVIEKLNESAPPTIKFLHANAVEIVENVKRLPQAMALLDGARYIIKIKLNGISKVEEEMNTTLNEKVWEIVKKTKKGEKLTDIKPFVKEFKYWVKDNELILNTLIATGSRENLSADLLVTYLKGKISEVNMDSFVNIKRSISFISICSVSDFNFKYCSLNSTSSFDNFSMSIVSILIFLSLKSFSISIHFFLFIKSTKSHFILITSFLLLHIFLFF